VGNENWRYVLSVEGREVELSDGEATLGRSRTSTVRLEHESVSRSHALLTLDRGQAIVKDLNSSNGTFVGGKRVLTETRLSNGDRVQLGAAVVELTVVPPAVPPGPSERTALLETDGAAPPAASSPPPAALTYDPGADVAAASPPPVAAKPPGGISASELFRDVDKKTVPPKDDSIVMEVLPPVPPSSPPQSGDSVTLPPGAADLAQMPIEISVNDSRSRPRSSERAAAFVERRAPSRTDAPRSAVGALPRLAATAVDAVILAAIDLLLMSPVFLILFFRGELQPRDAAPDMAFFAVTVLCALLILIADVVYVVGGWARRGRTPGKSLVGIALARRGTGTPGTLGIGWSPALKRAFFAGLGSIPLGLGFWLCAFRADRRAWHDLMTGTWVVKTR
jgi:pSer/pThr/pTyr-binding forkhead associated (FHA) protein